MKLLELNLIAFGPFSDCHIDLSGGEHGLHLIYGPNEAGKSSSLLAITYFLYGFPTQTPVDFKHSYKNLRIGGRLRHSDNTDLHVVRRKAKQKSLRCGNDQDAIDDDALAPFLGDVDHGLFTTMFGINHERLRSGGQEIAQGCGRIGELLFAAGAGVVDLQQIQNNLHSTMEGLLKSSGRSGSIHAGIQDYLANRKGVDEALVSVDAWNRIEENLRASRQHKQQLDQRLSQTQCELERLQRIQLAGPCINRWKARQTALLQLAQTPRLPIDFAQTVNQMLMDLRTGQLQLSNATSELEKVDAQLSELVVPEKLLLATERIELLRDRVGAIRAAVADRASVELKRESFEREAKDIMRELDRQPDLSLIDELRLPRDKTVKIQSLGNQLERLHERLQAERKSCEKLRREITVGQARLAETPAATDVAEIRATLRGVQQQGDIEAELSTAAAELKRLYAQIGAAVKRLPLFTGELSQLEQLPVPPPATVDRFQTELKTVDQQLASLQQQLKDDHREIESLQARLSELESTQVIPTLIELEQSRSLRDEGWQLVLASWQAQVPNKKSLSAFLEKFSTASDLAGAYQQAVQAADALADALRLNADRVATKTKLQSDHQQALTRQCRRTEQIEQAQAQRQQIELRWQEAWQSTHIQPLSPQEMQDWLRKHESILLLAGQLHQQEQQHDQLQQRLANARQRLLAVCQPTGKSESLHQKTLLELLHQLQDTIDTEQSTASRRTQLSERLTEDQSELASSESEYARTEAEINTLQTQWANEMERLGLEKSALPAQANSRLESLQSLFEKYKEADRYRNRIEHIDRDEHQFAEEVTQLVADVAPEMRSQAYDPAFQSLLGQLETARLAASRRSELSQRQRQLRSQQAEAQAATSQTQVQLDELQRQARVESSDALLPAAEQSRQRQELERQVLELEDEILGHAAGSSLTVFVAEVEQENQAADTVSARIAAAEELRKGLSEERDALLGQIRSGEIEEEQFDGSSLAAEKNASCESIAARLEEELQTLTVMRVAAAMLKEGIERHREKNQGPILSRASEIFRHITLGQFAGLQAEFNDKGEPVLAGIRGTGETVASLSTDETLTEHTSSAPTLFDLDETLSGPPLVPSNGQRVLVDGMSDGTCDQLYLALRLASLESWLAHHEPLPFIVDDVLMNFDDARAVATLKILAQLSRRTQVIFFTHHQHLVDLAREHLSPDDLHVATIKKVADNSLVN